MTKIMLPTTFITNRHLGMDVTCGLWAVGVCPMDRCRYSDIYLLQSMFFVKNDEFFGDILSFYVFVYDCSFSVSVVRSVLDTFVSVYTFLFFALLDCFVVNFLLVH